MTPSQRLERLARAERQRLAAPTRGQYHDDPVGYFREVLGIEPWSRQRDMLTAVATHSRVAVRSGHKVSKSNSCAGLAYWWADPRGRGGDGVVLTAPTGRQVEEILWREIRSIYSRHPDRFTAAPAKLPSTGLRFPDGRFIIGFATNEAERLQGFSGASLLFIVDEASGVDAAIFEAIEGNRAGGAHALMTGNPTQTTGTFFEAFGARAESWCRLHISSEESPNVTGIEPAVPGLATREWIEEKRREWGEESPLYAVRVRGDFPSQAENAVVGLALVQAGVERSRAGGALSPDDGPLQLGVDVARFGDDESAIAPRRGKRIGTIRVHHGLDTVEVAGAVLATVRELARDGETVRACVDVIGVGGGVVDHLRRQPRVELRTGAWCCLEVVGVNVSESAPTVETYARLRDQVWFSVAEFLEDGGSLPPDGRLEAELVAPLYSFDVRGRYVVESKDKTKTRLGRSPDRADAVGLAVFQPPRVVTGYRTTTIPDL